MAVSLTGTGLTEKQKQAIDLLVGADGDHTQQEIADMVGISRMQLYNWRKDKTFRSELVKQAKSVADSGLAKGMRWMEEAMDDPAVKPAVKVQILKLLMQSQGMLKDVQETSVKADVQTNMAAIYEQYGIKPPTK